MTISLTICLPDNVYVTENTDKVILPVENGNFTVIDGRAPTVLLLSTGLVQCLDEKNEVKKLYFINNAMADIANNVCSIAAERLIDLQKVTKDEIRQKAVDNKFYHALEERLKAFS